MRIIVVFAVFLSISAPLSVHSQTFGGIGTRAEGMGGAFVAVADDASAVYWNPAGIATGATFDLQIAAGPDAKFVGAALPVLAASYYRTREVTGLPTVSGSPDRQNGGSGEVHARTLTTTSVGVTVVQTVAPGLVVGTTARVVRGGLDASDGRTTVDLDAGALVSAWDIRFGVTARNIREPEFDAEGGGKVRMHRQFRVGAALAPRSLPTGVHGPFSLAVDVDLTTTPDLRGDRRMAAAGGEYWVAKGLIGARAGVRWSTLGDAYRAFSGGFTVRLPRSVFIEGQMTKWNEFRENDWTVGARVTF